MYKHYYWLKLKEDFFSSLKIKKLRKMVGGNLLTIIYLKMQLLSVKNGGILLFEGVESSFEEELALALDEDVDSVRTVLVYLTNQGMINRMVDGEYLIPDVVENVGSESDFAAKMRKLREKCAAVREASSHCDEDVRESGKNVTLDIEKYTDAEKERERQRVRRKKDIESGRSSFRHHGGWADSTRLQTKV